MLMSIIPGWFIQFVVYIILGIVGVLLIKALISTIRGY